MVVPKSFIKFESLTVEVSQLIGRQALASIYTQMHRQLRFPLTVEFHFEREGILSVHNPLKHVCKDPITFYVAHYNPYSARLLVFES